MQGALGVALIMLDALTSWRLPASIERAAGGPLGNTALAFHGKRLLALMEGGYPYVVRVCRGVLASVGLYKFGGALETPFTAHPKVDPGDGVMHAFAYLCATPSSPLHTPAQVLRTVAGWCRRHRRCRIAQPMRTARVGHPKRRATGCSTTRSQPKESCRQRTPSTCLAARSAPPLAVAPKLCVDLPIFMCPTLAAAAP